MQNKTYVFNGVTFATEKNVLKIQNAWLRVAMYFKKLTEMYTAECDMSAVQIHRNKLAEIEAKDRQDKSDLQKLESEEVLNIELADRIKAEIEKNKIELDKINAEFENDEIAKSQQAEYNEQFNYAVQSLLTSYDVINGFLEKYLIGDLNKLDYEDENVIPFISEVIGDFFLSKVPNKV